MDDEVLYRDAVGHVTRALRAERGWTLRELSARSGVSVPYVSEIERGRKEPSSAMLTQLATAFELPLPDLLRRVADLLEERATAVHAPELSRESLRRELDELADAEAAEVAEFLAFLRWRRSLADRP